MNDFHGTENEFTLDGVTYITTASENCTGCAFDHLGCTDFNIPLCTSTRKDGRDVIFIRKPATSDSQATMTYPPTTESKVAKSLDFSRPVQLRDGTTVRILCTDSGIPDYPVVGIIAGRVDIWTLEGKFAAYDYSRESVHDLVQTPQPRKYAELIKKWADDNSVRIKMWIVRKNLWEECETPAFNSGYIFEEILPGDPLY